MMNMWIAEVIWAPGEVKAAIVTCGGLCPGLNDVISELFVTLYYNYGVTTIYGIKQGYRGFWQPQYQPWSLLTPESIRSIHEQGFSSLLFCFHHLTLQNNSCVISEHGKVVLVWVHHVVEVTPKRYWMHVYHMV
jgi:6-phosphofructokinase